MGGFFGGSSSSSSSTATNSTTVNVEVANTTQVDTDGLVAVFDRAITQQRQMAEMQAQAVVLASAVQAKAQADQGLAQADAEKIKIGLAAVSALAAVWAASKK